MDNQYFKFNPGTFTTKAPMPVSFAHVLSSVAMLQQFLTIHNQQQLTNVNQLLQSTLNLQISNIIQRVIAQVIGQTDTGFATIKGTEDGSLHVAVQEDVASGRTIKQVAINENTGASNEIVAAVPGKQICIVNLVFTVGDEINITLQSAANALSGAMDFGGASEPRGMVSNNGNCPLKTNSGEAFNILMSAAVQVSGFVIYYEE